ncbi:hypothetical protein [Rhodococcus sp. WB1]|uniref:hypothetical protein n=1 Tax=Rhodococcus sp. WB1 TaxID=1033922 RepID=UPI0012F48926|nr:hypothetical protein [Rhodococcus sp. WB1]
MTWQLTDDDILDISILWYPIGGPPAARIHAAFGIGMNEYHNRLEAAGHNHQQKTLDTRRPLPDRIYAHSVLEGLTRQTMGAPRPPVRND